MKDNFKPGFTAIELLITLFVAAAFLVAGYQLYNLVIRDSGQTRASSKAANVAYNYLRQYSINATTPCTTSTPLSASEISVSGLSSVTVTVELSCPYPATTSVTKVDVSVSYNNPQETVEYSTYVNL